MAKRVEISGKWVDVGSREYDYLITQMIAKTMGYATVQELDDACGYARETLLRLRKGLDDFCNGIVAAPHE